MSNNCSQAVKHLFIFEKIISTYIMYVGNKKNIQYKN